MRGRKRAKEKKGEIIFNKLYFIFRVCISFNFIIIIMIIK